MHTTLDGSLLLARRVTYDPVELARDVEETHLAVLSESGGGFDVKKVLGVCASVLKEPCKENSWLPGGTVSVLRLCLS